MITSLKRKVHFVCCEVGAESLTRKNEFTAARGQYVATLLRFSAFIQ